MKKHILLISGMFLLSGCSLLNQDPNIPEIKVPITSTATNEEKALLNDKWWENFNDTKLNSFVEYALENNSDLQSALIKVEKFREFLNIKKSEQLPKIDAYADADKKRISKLAPPSYQGMTYESYDLGLSASFEIDLFGKLSNAKKAAFEDMMNQNYLKELLYQRVISDSIIAYYGLKSNQALYNKTQQQYLDEEETYNNIKTRYENGFIDRSTLLQEESLFEMTRDNMLAQKEVLDNYKTAVSILIGKDVNEVFEASNIKVEDTQYDSMNLPVPVNLPSDILNKRADIQAAQSKVKASAFSVSVAKSAYFPTFSLTGSLGYVSGDLDKLVRSDASSYTIGGNLLSPILDFGKINANVENAKKDQQLALIEYRDTIRNAFGDIKNALVSYSTNKERFIAQERRYDAIKEKKDISKNQYESGYISYLEFLEVRKEEASVGMQKERIKFEALKSAVNLYYNLGGGFEAKINEK
ncbi:MAG: TolC family protein [Arcobacteraceae bacterium]|nr:TolC family protein [Arcobacteraceae bacterium]